MNFVGSLASGGTVSFALSLDEVFGFQTVDFGGLFSDVTAVSWTQVYNYHQFDNLVLDASAAAALPEPASLALTRRRRASRA